MAFKYVDRRGAMRKQEDLANFEVVLVGQEATGAPDVVRVFTDQRQFRRWAKDSRVTERVDQVFATLKRDVLPERENEPWVQQMQTLALKRTRETFRAFAALRGLKPNDEEVIRLAVLERTPLTPSLFDPILLWDRRIEVEPPQGAPQDPRTNSLPVGSGYWPVLGWAGWDDRARSARVFGLNILHEHNWFGGRSAWLFGLNMLLNLEHLAFDRLTSSIISH
ncbi:hypothetical protein JY651_13720 [Pyxidicoccus parkwayensis]|uniref:Uncharacterized protein n=1 Tax=Pyxidicoccus parkwayensis TaxID=2813578 RepID=A0ABX7P630_9BACT|nr:hypothetical protein [Pyxidicoccus parkwaysis]QSQ25918.1 hypothetical protein JY651_13720 [Pyxidicoccus parkwaysis]